jgi:hypothetical protein
MPIGPGPSQGSDPGSGPGNPGDKLRPQPTVSLTGSAK